MGKKEKRWCGEEEQVVTEDEGELPRNGWCWASWQVLLLFVRLALQNEGVSGKEASTNGLK